MYLQPLLTTYAISVRNSVAYRVMLTFRSAFLPLTVAVRI